MKREIKFRAWTGYSMLMPLSTTAEQRMIDFEGNQYEMSDGIECDILRHVKQDYELMQFTGLLDKNGKEIYESDVVKHDFETDYGPQEHRDVVEFLGGAFYPVCEKPGNEYEVIGNIYENTDLL